MTEDELDKLMPGDMVKFLTPQYPSVLNGDIFEVATRISRNSGVNGGYVTTTPLTPNQARAIGLQVPNGGGMIFFAHEIELVFTRKLQSKLVDMSGTVLAVKDLPPDFVPTDPRYPSTCPKCKKPKSAYIGAFVVDCKHGCR